MKMDKVYFILFILPFASFFYEEVVGARGVLRDTWWQLTLIEGKRKGMWI